MAEQRKSRKKGKKSAKKRILKAIIILAAILLTGTGIIGYQYYKFRYKSNITLGDADKAYIYIHTGSDFNDVKNLLTSKHYLIDEYSFQWLSEKKGYTSSVKPGRYLLRNHMTNNALINMLRSGQQEPVKFTFNNVRTREQLAGRAGKMLEADSNSICDLLNDSEFLKDHYNMTPDEIMCIFIPNTYEFYWNTSPEELVKRMYKEFGSFWNTDRKNKAKAMGLDPLKVTVLASIIDQETKKTDEIPRIAGVYINRLNKGMLLQADPTVIFAIGDFSIKRVLKSHTEFASPYNTYLHTGLPPGPICLPSPRVIDQTLAYEKHDYLYFCAKEDFSGYHNFAKTLAQHNQNAAMYQRALNRQLNKNKN